jgi:hypothetical protein
MANEFAGSALYAQWIWSGGTVQINTDFRNWDYNDQGEEIDTTAGADSSRSAINSFDTGQVTASFLLLSTMGTVTFAAFKRGVAGTLIFGEAGTTSGYPKTTLPAKIQSGSRTSPYNDVAQMNVTWGQNGARVDGAY